MTNVLIIQTAFIGDVILTTSLIEKVHKYYPDAEVHMLVKKGCDTLFTNHPYVTKVYAWQKKGNKYRNMMHIIKDIRSEFYDLVINAHEHLSSGVFTALANAKFKVGYKENPLSFLYSEKISLKELKKQKVHVIVRLCALLDYYIPYGPELPKLYPSKQDYEVVKHKGDYYCMAPGSVWATKRLPQNKWVKMINQLDKNAKIYLLGGTDERKLCQDIKVLAGHTKVKNLAGKLSLLESCALMSKAKMNFTNDSAPLHMCSAMNAPVIAFFLNTAKELGYTPLGEKTRVLESEIEVDCKPCAGTGRKKCKHGHFKCAVIDVDEINEHIEQLLAK